MTQSLGTFVAYGDAWLLDGVRTGFADYTGILGQISPTDLGIAVARAVLARTGIAPADVQTTIAGSVAQASFDAYFLPRHIGLYAGVPIDRPAHLVQRICGTGIETLAQAAEAIELGKVGLALCVGAESMTRNPVAAYTHRTGFKMGQVEFKDFLWEALWDTATGGSMGHTAETVAERYGISREDVDAFAARSFANAVKAREKGFFDGEIVPLASQEFALDGYKARGIRLPRGVESFAEDTHVRPTSPDVLAKIRPAFGGVQTGGNSSAIVDGAAAALVASGRYVEGWGKDPLARLRGCATVGVPPEIMSIGPAPAIRRLLDGTGLPLEAIDRIEINEAFGAQVIGVERELGLDRDRLNVNGGAIAIGHPLAATGLRLAVTVSRELRRSGGRYGIASACIGGGQGIALLVENPAAA
ncbi:MAG: acetyl-CoA acetyltransferase [Rhodospirillaceae bacterium BRH_c57]|nr:MAG: acetyl-CoA acetyltransferase [Rhodospirillaceae bacterium BRH_c57]